MKIAFNLLGDRTWQAGLVYMTNLIHALRMTEGDEVLSLLLCATDTHVPEELKNLIDETLVCLSYQKWTAVWFIDRVSKKLLQRDLLLDRLLRRHQVRVVAFDNTLRGSGIPSLSWLPDFQHVHFPEMFSSEECLARDHSFMHIAEKATRVLLLSESVKHDYEAFAPAYAHKARVLSHVTYVPKMAYELQPKLITDIYHLPEKFIYLPNQFWKHKNHIAVFQALKILKDRGIEVFLVCSGNLTDYRHPDYWSYLLQEILYLGIRNQIAILGLVPREHVFQLIRQSICVLNPSLFEGYGMTVDEAHSFGKLILLSDIPVHREQNPPNAVFFNQEDYEDLANKIGLIWSTKLTGPNLEMEKKAQQDFQEHMEYFAESFMSVVKEVVD